MQENLCLGACRRETLGENFIRKTAKECVECIKKASKFTSKEIFPGVFPRKRLLSDSLLADLIRRVFARLLGHNEDSSLAGLYPIPNFVLDGCDHRHRCCAHLSGV